MAHILDKCKEMRYGNIPIKGHSVSAGRTGFYSSKFGIHFDAGMGSHISANRILLTHGHADHSQHLVPLMVTKHRFRETVEILCPSEIQDVIKKHIETSFELYDTKFPFTIIGMNPSDTHDFTYNNTKYRIECIKCYHNVPAIGFGIYQEKTKIKQEILDYVNASNLPKNEQIELFKNPENSVTSYDPVFAYLCDTNQNILSLNTQNIQKFPVMMIESTFLYDEDIRDCDHLSFNQINSFAKNYPNNLFVGFHFSKRYTIDQIKEHFAKHANKNFICHVDEI